MPKQINANRSMLQSIFKNISCILELNRRFTTFEVRRLGRSDNSRIRQHQQPHNQHFLTRFNTKSSKTEKVKLCCIRKLSSTSIMSSTSSFSFVFPPPPIPSVEVVMDSTQNTLQVPIEGSQEKSSHFPIHRIYCVAKNYVDHVKEMGGDPVRETPCFFMKPADAVVDCSSYSIGNNETTTVTKIPYPLQTNNLHYEIELVIALGKGGKNISIDDAMQCIYGYAVGW